MTTYTPNIPQPTDEPSKSQDQILQNFQTINTAFAQDHVDLTNAALSTPTRGKHKFVHLVQQGSAPTTVVTEGVLYNKSVTTATIGTRPELFWRRDNRATEFQISGPFLTGADGYTPLYGGLIMQWGTTTSLNGGAISVTFPITLSADPYAVLICPIEANVSRRFYKVTVKSTTGFTGVVQDPTGAGQSGIDINWIAIGSPA